MDLTRVVEILKRAQHDTLRSSVLVPESPGGTQFVGNHLLRCAACDSPMMAEHRSRGWKPDPLNAVYMCQNLGCEAVRVSVRMIDRELQAFVVRRWSRPGFVTRWRRARLAELDAETAEAHAVREYCRDPRRRAEVARGLGGRRRLIRFRVDEDDLLWCLHGLIKRTARLVTERAELSAALGRRPTPDGTARLAELERVRSDHAILSMPASGKKHQQLLAQVFGDKKQRAARLADLDERLWALLAETDWQDAVAAPSPTEESALAGDWGKSPNTMVGRRRALLDVAVGGDRLVLDPKAEDGAVLLVILAGEPLDGADGRM